jgi:hypothetical protein
MMTKKCVYVFLRKDLDPVQRAVQASHVCLDLGRKFPLPDERYRIVIFGIRSQAKLQSVIQELIAANVKHLSYLEPDINALTAIATEPLDEIQGQLFSRYRLLEA